MDVVLGSHWIRKLDWDRPVVRSTVDRLRYSESEDRLTVRETGGGLAARYSDALKDRPVVRGIVDRPARYSESEDRPLVRGTVDRPAR